jgi:hypothetical protein
MSSGTLHSPNKTLVDFDSSITPFLCTDVARDIFEQGGKQLDTMTLRFPNEKHPDARLGQPGMSRRGSQLLQIRRSRGLPRLSAQAIGACRRRGGLPAPSCDFIE